MSNIWNVIKDVVSIGQKVEKMNEIDDEHLAAESQDGYDFNFGIGEEADYRTRNRSPRIAGMPYQAFFVLMGVLCLVFYLGYKKIEKQNRNV